MKTSRCLAVVAIVLMSAGFAHAQGVVTGVLHVAADGTLTKNVEFNARANGDGSGDGQISFNGPAVLPDTDEDGHHPGAVSNLSMKARLDCVVIEGSRAAMSGAITESTDDSYLGRRFLLAVEDGGNGGSDKFTWGIYNSKAMSWFPVDAESPGDAGWNFTWTATDAERPDDKGVKTTRNTLTDCRSFSLGSIDYIEIPNNGGNVLVRP
jgi:hypothetical protein